MSGIVELVSVALVATSALFFVVDPIGLVPVFVAMTEGDPAEKRRATARKACLIFVGVMFFFAATGTLIFDLLGVSLAAFKIAGGLLLLFTALDMLRSKRSDTRTSGEELGEAAAKEDIAVVPLAMPLLAGPGAIATVTVLSSRSRGALGVAALGAAILLTALATYLLLRAARVVDRWLGIGGRAILERVMGLLLAAIAIQFVVTGVRESFPETFPAAAAAAFGAAG